MFSFPSLLLKWSGNCFVFNSPLSKISDVSHICCAGPPVRLASTSVLVQFGVCAIDLIWSIFTAIPRFPERYDSLLLRVSFHFQTPPPISPLMFLCALVSSLYIFTFHSHASCVWFLYLGWSPVHHLQLRLSYLVNNHIPMFLLQRTVFLSPVSAMILSGYLCHVRLSTTHLKWRALLASSLACFLFSFCFDNWY